MQSANSSWRKRLKLSSPLEWMRPVRPGWIAAICAAIFAFASGRLTCCSSKNIETNENLINGLRTSLDLEDATAVFSYVFSALPLRAVVYPSGDYYYFRVPCNRNIIRGNIRLGPEVRNDRALGFSYSLGVPGRDKTISVRFGSGQGLYLIALGRRAWLCQYRWKTVVFFLYQIVTSPPTRAQLSQGETWVAPVLDESGLQFYLVFQKEPAHLFWILNQDVPVLEDFDFAGSDIAIGRRTRFAFYIDQRNNRWILVGVNRRNSSENSWYDGPFDQLPVDEIASGQFGLRKYFEAVYPDVRGQIDDYGRYKLLPQTDVAVVPWALYDQVCELAFIEKCKAELSGPAFYSCITPDPFAAHPAPADIKRPAAGVPPWPDDGDRPGFAIQSMGR